MDTIVTPGLVLKETRYKESDRILTILTPELGVISASAQSSLRLKNKLFSACGLFCYSEFVLLPGRNMYTIREAEVRNVFHGISSTIEGMSLAMYLAEMAASLSPTGEEAGKELRLLLNCLYMISEHKADLRVVKAVFELRAACLSGYTPDLTGCHVCGSQTPERFDLSAGMLECRNCRSPESNGIRMPVPPSVLEAMRYICYCDSKKLFSFQAGEDTLQQLSEVTEAYLATQLERGFSTLDFYKSLLI